MTKTELMKDQLGRESITIIADALSATVDNFAYEAFIRDASDNIETLELKQRVNYLINVLHDYLPSDFSDSATILLAIAKNGKQVNQAHSWTKFTAWPLVDYVAVYGLECPELALQVLKQLTSLFSAEFAIRPFIEQHFELTHTSLLSWCIDDSEHIRRLSSEGIRPRLPWGKQLPNFITDPSPILPILELLRNDSSLYVRKSVANNLNDIAKDNPELVISTCRQWMANNPSAETMWIIRHGLRSLIKQGRPEVFPLLGYSEKVKAVVTKLELDRPTVNLGEGLAVTVELKSSSDDEQRLVLDYKIHHKKANGKTTAKVFKWKNVNLVGLESMTLTKVHPFKAITTRKYYSGQHALELLINGQSMGQIEFELMV